jgi:alkylation response protein AidB-like acyl-CoA dehydrogenase
MPDTNVDSEQTLREEVRAFLAEHQPSEDEIPVPEDYDAYVTFLRGWQRQLSEAGLVGITWPAAHGGRGGTQREQIVVNEELARAEAPRVIGFVGVDVIGPSLVEHGTAKQHEAHLARLLSAEDIWCQGFSEPGAGSDLASLKTRAVDCGDHFELDGQKIWTSFATHARWCAVLARTDQDAPAHRGISYLLVDLRSPGITIRPLVQVTGDPEFGEVFFDSVKVPKENVLGALNGGWQIAMHTLTHERGPAAMAVQVRLRVALERLFREAATLRRGGRPAIERPEVSSALARAHAAVEVLRCQTNRSAAQAAARGKPSFEVSVDKIVVANTEQVVTAAALEVLGPNAAFGDGFELGVDAQRWRRDYMIGRASLVYGGSVQIQKNILSGRVLGLPMGPS